MSIKEEKHDDWKPEKTDVIKELEALQARLAIVGGGKIIITSTSYSIKLGKEHEDE